jgi:hypothetical protein
MSGQNNKQQQQQKHAQNLQKHAERAADAVQSVEGQARGLTAPMIAADEKMIQDTPAPVVESKEEVSGTSTRQGDVKLPTSLEPHEALDLRTFTELVDAYIKRYLKKTVFAAEDLEAHRSLIMAIRMMFNFNEKVLREAFADLVGRMSVEQPGNCLTLPTLVKHLHTDEIVSSSTERVFIVEFLLLLQRFAMLEDKTAIRKRTNFQEIFSSISDKKVRDRLEGLFPKA